MRVGTLFRDLGQVPVVLAGEWRLLVVAGVLAITVQAVLAVRRARAAAVAIRHGSWVEVQPPPGVTRPEDAVRFWLGMTELLRRRWHGWLPHAGLEFSWAGGLLAIRVWVPAAVSATAVREMAEAAWPGAVTRLVNASAGGLPPVVADGLGAHAAGGHERASTRSRGCARGPAASWSRTRNPPSSCPGSVPWPAATPWSLPR
jgi:hypothetical protein